MFPVAALIIKSFSSLSSQYRKIQCLTSELHGKFYVKNLYCMNHEAMSATSAFPVKFTL